MNFADDTLANSLIIHAAGTKATLDRQEPIHGNAKAALIAHIKGLALPADNSYFQSPSGRVYLFLNGRKRPATEVPRAQASFLRPNEVLLPGQARHSSTTRLLMQDDGNLVVYRKLVNVPLWASRTVGRGARAIMQSDGNFVIYDSNGRPSWATNTNGHPGAHLRVQDDGNVVLYAPDGRALWATGTRAPAEADPGDIPEKLQVLPDDLIDALDEDLPYEHVKGSEQPAAVPPRPASSGGGGLFRVITAAAQQQPGFFPFAPPATAPASSGGGSGGGGSITTFFRRQMMGFSGFADVVYTVQPGDTLTQIAIDHGLCEQPSGNTRAAWAPCLSAAQKIAALNKLPNVNAIQAGQTLVLASEPVVSIPNLPAAPAASMKKAGLGGTIFWGALALGGFWYSVGGNTIKGKRRRRRVTKRRSSSRRRR